VRAPAATARPSVGLLCTYGRDGCFAHALTCFVRGEGTGPGMRGGTRLVRYYANTVPFGVPGPGRAARPPRLPYHPNGRPYVGVQPDSTTTPRTKFHTHTEWDGVSIRHAKNWSNSQSNGFILQPNVPHEDVEALLDRERRRNVVAPFPAHAATRSSELEGSRGGRK